MIANVLTIAGTDPTGGAGIQADLKTFSALGAYGMSVVTAVVAQNTCGVRSVRPLDASFVAEQIDAVFDDVRVDAVKIGMVGTAQVADAIADRLVHHKAERIVLDPVMVAQSGDRLLTADAVRALRDVLAPIATLMTPNLPEAGVLLGEEAPKTIDQMGDAAKRLQTSSSNWVLLKGGHSAGSECLDILCGPGCALQFRAPRIQTTNDHGTGCTLSAAIAALLPSWSIEQSVRHAKAYLGAALADSSRLDVGRGHGPVHHFHAIWQKG